MVVIFFDLDGVLCNFVKGALRRHGREDVPHRDVPWGLEEHLGIDPPLFWAALDREFAETLEPYPDGMSLLRYAESLVGAANIGLLTSPWDTAGCFEGKKAWVAKHLPEYRSRLFTGSAKELQAGPTKVLVDDRNENVDRFVAPCVRGLGLLVPRPWNRRKAETTPSGGFDPKFAQIQLSCLVLQAYRNAETIALALDATQ